VKELIRILKFLFGFNVRLIVSPAAILFVFFVFAGQARAMEIKTNNPDVKIRFDNTLTYSLIDRLNKQDAALIADPNTDDGDRNFNKGIVMNRLDLLSEFDVSYQKFGVHLNGAAWYDTIYNKRNDNNSPFTANAVSVPYNQFTEETKELHGRDAELREAFTFGTINLGNMGLTYRAGQFTQWWGESFFMGDNGIAGGLAPVDVAKAATLPNTQGKELIMPIPQALAMLQLTDNLSFGAYYQFAWKPTRLFGSGSLFSPADMIGPGAERIWGANFLKAADMKPSDSGQFGIKMEYALGGWDLGLYALKYHSKDFYVVVKPIEHQYTFFYPEDIKAYGVSANTSIGIWTLAAEVTYRKNAPFKEAANSLALFPAFIPFVPHEVMYPAGDSLHANFNLFMPGLPSNFFSDTATLIFEVGWNDRLKVTKNLENLDTTKKKSALKMQIVYEPKWYQFFSNFDLILPIGANYAPEGRASAVQNGEFGTNHGGDFNIGVGGTYNNVWDLQLTYRKFFGSTEYQHYADRNYVSFFIRRTF
jgi:hypothetical protein